MAACGSSGASGAVPAEVRGRVLGMGVRGCFGSALPFWKRPRSAGNSCRGLSPEPPASPLSVLRLIGMVNPSAGCRSGGTVVEAKPVLMQWVTLGIAEVQRFSSLPVWPLLCAAGCTRPANPPPGLSQCESSLFPSKKVGVGLGGILCNTGT